MKTDELQNFIELQDQMAPRAAAMARRVKQEFTCRGGPLADKLVRETKSKVDVIDCGYDVSCFGRRTAEPFRAGDFGAEFKYAGAPRLTKSMRIALEDLGLAHLWVIYPGSDTLRLAKNVTAVPLAQARHAIAAQYER